MIYVAGPFFTPEERTELEKMIQWIKHEYYDQDLFIPMEHFIPYGETMTNERWAQSVFTMDKRAIDRCSMVIALYLGHYSDTGTAWEIGYANAKNIPVKLYIPEEYRSKDMSIMPICSSIPINYNRSILNQK